MLSKNHPIILFIDRFGFSLYQDALTNIPKFNFTPDLVSNLDVVSKDQFTNLISTFIQINKIVPSSLAVILSDNIIYAKDLADDKEHKDEVQNFLEDVPFEEVLAKVIKVGNVNRIAAVNKDLVMAIADAFVSKGAIMEAIIPSFMYGQSANFTAGLTLDNVRVILQNTETLRLGNLLTDQEEMIPSQGLESELKISPDNGVKKPKNLRQYILIGIFVVLLIVLGVVYLVSQTPPKITNKINVLPTVPPAGGPTLVQESPTVIPIDLKLISIKISHSAASSGIAVNLKSGLSGMEFENITDEVSEVSIPEKSSVIFSPSIPADLRNNIITEIKKVLPDISILENQDVNFTVSILIGKS